MPSGATVAVASAITGDAEVAVSLSQTVNGNCALRTDGSDNEHDAHHQDRARAGVRDAVVEDRDHSLRDDAERKGIGDRLSGRMRAAATRTHRT